MRSDGSRLEEPRCKGMKIIPEERRSKLERLQPRPYLLEDPEELVHIDWSVAPKECVESTNSLRVPDEIEEGKQKQVRSKAIDALLRLRREQAPARIRKLHAYGKLIAHEGAGLYTPL